MFSFKKCEAFKCLYAQVEMQGGVGRSIILWIKIYVGTAMVVNPPLPAFSLIQ